MLDVIPYILGVECIGLGSSGGYPEICRRRPLKECTLAKKEPYRMDSMIIIQKDSSVHQSRIIETKVRTRKY